MSELPCFHGPDIRNLPVMAYSPLGAAVALAWMIRSGSVIAIPESGSPAHVKENAVALSMALTPRDLQTLNAAFPGPFGAT
jgi:diketogulonate reductase-like aldo/keto reductase